MPVNSLLSECIESNIIMLTVQQQYIQEWHDNFVKYIQDLLSFIEALMILPQATDKDKQALDRIKLLLHGKEAQGIEQELAAGIVRQDTLDRIEKLDKNLTGKRPF